MPDLVAPMAHWSAAILEALGVLIVTSVALYALAAAAVRLARRERRDEVVRGLRQSIGHGILLGLEFLVAADIINTVAVDLRLETVGVLAIVVVIRTFLSFTLAVELTGRWPWEHERSQNNQA